MRVLHAGCTGGGPISILNFSGDGFSNIFFPGFRSDSGRGGGRFSMVFGGFGEAGWATEGMGEGRSVRWSVGQSGGGPVLSQSCPSLGPVLAQSWPSHSKEKLVVILHLVCFSLV